LTNKSLIKQIYDFGIQPKKTFGQNFLIDTNILQKIVNYSGKIENQDILEIGPGLGFLTEQILKYNPKKLVCVELDHNLIKILETKFNQKSNFILINQDALLIKEEEYFDGNFKIISNLPYNISVPLLIKWLKNPFLINEIIVMVQKEVAYRLVANERNKDYGIVSVMINYLANSVILFDVSAECFYLKPKVNSAVIKISFVKSEIEQKLLYFPFLERIVKTVFNNRRKMLRNTLPRLTENWQGMLKYSGVLETARPEEVSIKNYEKMAIFLKNFTLNNEQ
jgi:16S rRNA (adenine1518-N6/adenine1519-N6)-dimethyltransferase